MIRFVVIHFILPVWILH